MGKRTNMTLVGFLQAQNCSNLPGSWRHPEAIPDFLTADHYVRIARTLEEGKFHLAFFDDRLAMPDIYGGNPAEVVANGVRVVKLDPVATLLAMGFGTRRLGIGATASTTYYEPFDVARRFQTVDHMLGGRAAWNVVTSVNDGEAQNMGRENISRTTCATTAPTSSWRSSSAAGMAGKTMRWWSTSSPGCSHIRTKCTAWSIAGNT